MINSFLQAISLLLLRVGFGVMMLAGHGLPKLLHFGTLLAEFPDPIGLGRSFSLVLAIFAEFFCSVLIVLGIATRLAAIPLVITMLIALALVHAADPWQSKELAAVYLVAFTVILISGGGTFALDHLLWRWRKRHAAMARGSST